MQPADSSRAIAKLRVGLLASALCGFASLGGCAPFDAQQATTTETFSNRKVRALVEAAEKGDVTTIDALVKEGVDVNAKGRGNVTPLLRCLIKKNKEGYEALLRHGGNPDVRDAGGNGVMHWAAREEDPFWLRLALEHGGNPNLINTGNSHSPNSTPLYYAIHGFNLGQAGGQRASGRVECVKLLIAAKADLNHKGGGGTNPLLEAVLAGNYEIVFLLLEGGADFSQTTTRDGQTVVDWMARREALAKEAFERVVQESQRPWFRKCVEFLKAKGVDMTLKKQGP